MDAIVTAQRYRPATKNRFDVTTEILARENMNVASR